MPAKRIELVPAWLETERIAAPLDPILDRWIQRHRPLFSTALFFRPEYGFELLIDALVQLRNRYPSLGCLVMGSGEQHAQAAERIRQAGLDENVLLLGDVDHDRCLELISRSDVFLRGTFEDGDSISVREALSLGVPVVASRVGTRPDGTILFQSGNLEDMVTKINLAIVEQKVERSPVVGWMDRLMDIYRQVVISGSAYVST
jgi:glycosyltransferase involved in cell wall biosynthesis